MPLYEYKCKQCDEVFELLRSRSEADTQVPCPRCKEGPVTRLMSVFCGRSGSGGESHAVAGSGRCAGCSASSCAGCRR